ncbi:hypothetical protein [Pandoraea sputorum]|uniref:hypothetical protein n=1 Tax=Pandoraea sputorum TaxID=93222 RepID=UPI002B321865|nr:hypothetical protein THI4931_21110 [Pandoraea sputorum]
MAEGTLVAAAATLAAPVSNEAKNGAVNPPDLSARGATFTVKSYPTMADGDYVQLFFTVDGVRTQVGEYDVSDTKVGTDLVITVPKATMTAALNKTIGVDYVVSPFEGDDLTSASLPLFIGVRAVTKLIAPVVVEATGDQLDVEFLDYGISVRIPIYAGMAINDEIRLLIGTPGESTFYTDKIKVRAVRAVTFSVPPNAIVPFKNRKMPVAYEVVRTGVAAPIPSEVLGLKVGEVEDPNLLAVPVISEATGSVLNPDLAPTGVTALIGPYAGIADGDYVHVVWAGGPPAGAEWYLDISEKYLNAPYPLRIPVNKITPFIGQKVTLSYSKEMPDGSWQPSKALVLDVKRESAAVAAPVVPSSANGQLDIRDVDPATGVVVTVPANAGIRQGDVITLYWDSEVDEGDYTSNPYIVKATDVGQDIRFTVPYSRVRAGGEKMADVSYDITRGAAVVFTGEVTELVVRNAVTPAAEIVQAINDRLNPDDCPNGVHVRIPATAKLRLNDEVTVTLRGAPGGGTMTQTAKVTQTQAGGELIVVLPKSVAQANIGRTISLEYSLKRANGGAQEVAPPARFDVVAVPGKGQLLVMGARNLFGDPRASHTAQYISSFIRATRQPVKALWKYDDESEVTLATTFRDRRPWMTLQVSTQDDVVTLNPVNIFAVGTTTNAAGQMMALTNRGSVVTWGANSANATGVMPSTLYTLDDVIDVASTNYAFALRRLNGRIAVWGNASYGGVLPAGFSVTDARRIVGNAYAFALVRNNGQLAAWGHPTFGGQLNAAAKAVTDGRMVYSTMNGAFACVRAGGNVTCWGHASYGGNPGQDILNFTDILGVRGTWNAFVAYRRNGTVVAWGDPATGGVVPPNIAARFDIVVPGAASVGAFTAITANKEVVVWGHASYGGTVPTDIASFTDIEETTATQSAFCARRSNGSVVAWGHASLGGVVPADIARRNDIVQVVASAGAFAALCRDGTVVAWGDQNYGGNTAPVAGQLRNVVAVYAGPQCFVAVLEQGGIVTWGLAAAGGNSASVQQFLVSNLTYLATAASRGRIVVAS